MNLLLSEELNEPWDALIGSEATLSEFVEAALPVPPCPSSVASKMSEKKEVHADQNGIRKSSLTLETQVSYCSSLCIMVYLIIIIMIINKYNK